MTACPDCGGELRPGYSYCPRCGRKIDKASLLADLLDEAFDNLVPGSDGANDEAFRPADAAKLDELEEELAALERDLDKFAERPYESARRSR